MPASTTLRKAGFAAILAAAFAGGLYWKFGRGPDTPAAPADDGKTPLLRLPPEALGPVSDADREILRRAEARFGRGEFAAALAELNKYGAKDDGLGHLRGVLLAGGCLLNLGQFAEAAAAFDYVVARRPDDLDAHRGLADAFGRLGATGREQFHLERVADLDPADYRPLAQIAALGVQLEAFAEAESAARRALKRNPPAAAARDLRRDLAESLFGLKRFAEAFAAVPEADSPATRAVRAACLRELTRRPEAEVEIDAGLKAANIDPPARARLLLVRGLIRADDGDDGSAVPAFEASLAVEPFNMQGRLQLALALRRLGQNEKADAADAQFKDAEAKRRRVTDLNQQAIAKPEDPAVRRELAAALLAIRRPDLSEYWLRAAESLEARPK